MLKERHPLFIASNEIEKNHHPHRWHGILLAILLKPSLPQTSFIVIITIDII